jgi:putative alpha-1,2-mannosidase
LICFNFCYRFLAVAAPGKYLDIVALGTGPGTVYVDQVTLNGAPLAGATVEDGPLQQDAVLRFIMRGEWWCS